MQFCHGSFRHLSIYMCVWLWYGWCYTDHCVSWRNGWGTIKQAFNISVSWVILSGVVFDQIVSTSHFGRSKKIAMRQTKYTFKKKKIPFKGADEDCKVKDRSVFWFVNTLSYLLGLKLHCTHSLHPWHLFLCCCCFFFCGLRKDMQLSGWSVSVSVTAD